MTTRLELAYLLRKEAESDQFGSELPVQVPIQSQIRFLSPAAMEAAGSQPDAMMGVRIQQGGNHHQTLKFVRRSPIGNLAFPDVSQNNSEFEKLRFRILTTTVNQGQETTLGVFYEIDSKNCRVVGGNSALGANWVVLVILENGNFSLLYNKEAGGPGGGDPCADLGCANTDDWTVKIKCIFNGCTALVPG